MPKNTHPFRVSLQFPEDTLAQKFVRRVRASSVRRAVCLALDEVLVKSHSGIPRMYRHLNIEVERLEVE